MNQRFADFEGPADGTTCSAANLLATTRGGSAGVWTVDGSGADMKFASAASKGLVYPALLGDGTIIQPNVGALGVQYLTDSVVSYLVWHLAGVGNPVAADDTSAGCWFFSDLANTDESNLDVFTIYSLGAVNFCNAKFLGAPSGLTRCFQLEVGGGGGNSSVNVTASTWYWLSLIYRKTGNHELKIYRLNGSILELVGSIAEVSSGVNRASYIAIGQAASNVPTTGKVVNFDSLLVDFDATYPLLPGTPTSGVVTTLNATTLTVG